MKFEGQFLPLESGPFRWDPRFGGFPQSATVASNAPRHPLTHRHSPHPPRSYRQMPGFTYVIGLFEHVLEFYE